MQPTSTKVAPCAKWHTPHGKRFVVAAAHTTFELDYDAVSDIWTAFEINEVSNLA